MCAPARERGDLQNLLQRTAHELTLFYQRMGEREFRCMDVEVVVVQEVDVDGAVVILSVGAFPGAAQLALDVLGGGEAFLGR